ncbi:histidine phosphatase family protein [Herbiconiux sp. P15]|uniref:histidine phosphatase family protein n=1 Tax=Herbiconiux liukaitaii TaxID=3342799 RepID=UPI0035BB7110
MTTLLLVRHGATDWTGQLRLQGRTDIGLSESGRLDAAALAPVVASWRPVSLVVSPLSRSRSTASILTGLEPVIDDRWAEAGLGSWEGRRADELGVDYARWRAGTLVPPGGEQPELVTERVRAATLAAVAAPGPVLVVTHGGTIRTALASFVGLTADHLEPVAAPSLTVLDVEPDGAARLRHYNLR